MSRNLDKKPIVLCSDGRIWTGKIQRESHGSYVWLETKQGEVVLVWNIHWEKWNLIGGHWEEQKDGTDKNGDPNYLKTAMRELIEELKEYADIESSKTDFKFEFVGLTKYVAFSEREKLWTQYCHALYKVSMSEKVEKELEIRTSSEKLTGKLKMVSKDKLALGSELYAEIPVANTINIFISLFPKLLSQGKC